MTSTHRPTSKDCSVGCPAKTWSAWPRSLQGQQQDLQQFISDSPWQERPVWDAIATRADARLGGHEDSMLAGDESCFAKQGKASVGVARQHNGRLGKTDNCQVGVFTALVRGTPSALVGCRLFVPEEWTADQPRCLEAGMPEEQIVVFAVFVTDTSFEEHAR